MKKTSLSKYLLLSLALLPVQAFAQEQKSGDEEETQEQVVNPAAKQKLVEDSIHSMTIGNNYFAFDLYGQLKTRLGNLFFSPYSISSAIAMPYAGAVGATKEQIHSVMHYLQNDTNLFLAFDALNQHLTRSFYEGPNETRLFLANSLWIQRDLRLLPSFTSTMATYFKSALRLTDFMRNPESARYNINGWVKEKTNGRIPDILSEGDVGTDTRLVVISTIYMKAVWEQAFEPTLTRQGSFFVNPIKTGSVQFMNAAGRFPIYSAKNFTLLEMPYRASHDNEPHFSFLVFLPKENFGLSDVEKTVAGETIETWLRGLQERQVIVEMPKFKLVDTFDIGKTLQALGMGIPFSNAADFSGIAGANDLKINQVIHKSYLDVDEKGTEAVAATAVTIGLTSVGPAVESPLIFRADHPFMFLIVDRTTNAILFMGRLISPE